MIAAAPQINLEPNLRGSLARARAYVRTHKLPIVSVVATVAFVVYVDRQTRNQVTFFNLIKKELKDMHEFRALQRRMIDHAMEEGHDFHHFPGVGVRVVKPDIDYDYSRN
jgi:hypothetical protein